MDISVVIPVFNTQEYIADCLNSVLNQINIDRIEIILVNDGSTDNSLEICKEYHNKYSNITLITIENQGAAYARNVGLKKARADYIMFLDSDDYYLETNALFKLHEKIKVEEVSFVCFNYMRYWQKQKTYSNHRLANLTTTSKAKIIKKDLFTSSPCLKIVSRKFLIENNFFFEEGLYAEDIEWNANLLLKAESMMYVGDIAYVYRLRENSVTTSISNKHVQDLIYIIKKMASSSNEKDQYYMSYVAFQYCTLLINSQLVNLKKEEAEEIYRLKYLLNNNISDVVKTVQRFSRVFGIKITAKALYWYFKLKQ